MSNAELNFYTRMPDLLLSVAEQIKNLTKEVAELKEQLKTHSEK